MAGPGVGSGTLKSLEEERGRHIKPLCLQGLFPPHPASAPGLRAPCLGSVFLARLGAHGEHVDWASEPGRAGSHPSSGIPGCVASGTWLTLSRPQLEKGFGKTTSEDCCKRWLGRPMPGVCSLRRALTGPFSASPLQGRVPPLQQSPQACLLSPQRVTRRTP